MSEVIYKAGHDLEGHTVSIWKVNRSTKKSFKAYGKCIQYKKGYRKGTNMYLIEYPPTIYQTQPFRMWHFRSSITQED